jgi:hypothetical protein
MNRVDTSRDNLLDSVIRMMTHHQALSAGGQHWMDSKTDFQNLEEYTIRESVLSAREL